MDISSIEARGKLIKDWNYNWTPLSKGYTDKILYINLGTSDIREKDVPLQMKEKFIGGKGYGLRLLWDGTTPATNWDDPENEIIISSGPIGGITQYSGTGKSLVVTISPQTNSVMDSIVGVFFAPFLKFSVFDAI
jgi:aldehyde:ferredoxin oxidoreductase